MASDRPWFDALVDDDGSSTVGSVWNKTQIKAMTDALDGHLNGASLSNPTSIAISAGWQTAPLGTVDWDSAAYFNGAGKFVIAPGKGGLYLFTASCAWDSAGTARGLQILSGATTIAQGFTAVVAAPGGPGYCLSAIYPVAASANVQLNVWSDAAANLFPGCRFSIVRL